MRFLYFGGVPTKKTSVNNSMNLYKSKQKERFLSKLWQQKRF